MRNRRENLLRLATWNVQGTFSEGTLKNLSEELGKYKIDLAAIQETKQKENQIPMLKNYALFNSENQKRIFGAAFLVRKSLINRIIEIKSISEIYTEEKLEFVKQWADICYKCRNILIKMD